MNKKSPFQRADTQVYPYKGRVFGRECAQKPKQSSYDGLRACSIKRVSLKGSFLPGSLSTPLLTSTPKG